MKLLNERIDIPWWLWIVIVLEALPMFVGPYVAVTNPQFMGGPEAETVTYAAFIYAIRNIAVGLTFGIALWLRNAPLLFGLIFIRLVTDVGDLSTFLSFGLAENPSRLVAIFVFFYYIPAFVALRYLWKQMRSADG